MAPLACSTVARSEPTDPPQSGLQISATFSARVPEYADRGRFWARRLRIPDQYIDDLVQDSLEAMWMHLSELSPEVWLAWFDTAFKNKNKHRRRKHARWKNKEPLYANAAALAVHPATCGPVAVLENRWLVAKVGRIIEGLASELGIVAQGYLLENMSMEEIAASVGVPVNTVRNRWRMAQEAIEEQFNRDRAKERLHLGAVGAFFLFLFARLFARFRRSSAPAEAPRAAHVAIRDAPVLPREPRASGLGLRARWLMLAVIPAVLITYVAINRATRPIMLVATPEPAPITEIKLSTVGLFLPAWAEREVELGVAARTVRRPARSPSASAAARPAASSAPPVHPLLSKAREALRLGHFTEAAAALHDYEIDHPDPTKDALHRSLRIEVELRGLDAAPLIQ